MGRFAPTYTDQQKQGLYRHCIDKRVSVAQAVRDAAAGTMVDVHDQPLDPWTIQYSYAAELVRDEKKKRKGRSLDQMLRGTPDEAHAAMIEEARAILLHQTASLRKAQGTAKGRRLNAVQLEELRKTLQAGRELRQLEKGVNPSRGPDKKQPASNGNGNAQPEPAKPPAQSEATRAMLREIANGGSPRQSNGQAEPKAKQGSAASPSQRQS